MKIIGYYSQPGTLDIKTPYYDCRYNINLAYNSSKELGLQVLIDYFNSLMWINIDKDWMI